MKTPTKLLLEITSTTTFINSLEEEASEKPEQIEVLEKKERYLPSDLSFGMGELTDIATIVTLIQGAFFVGDLAIKLFQKIKKSEAPKVVIKDAIQEIEILNNETLTEDIVRTLLMELITNQEEEE